jgi:protein-S-isoprenylcysteine O-methyltransferase Ste14
VARIMAWLGGIAFVASLAYTSYFYAVVLGRPSADGTAELPRAVAANVALFTVFAMHHSVFAREPVKRWIARRIPAQMERSFYVWLASALLIAVCLLWQRVPGIVVEITGPLRWMFYAVQLVGLALIWRAADALDPLELAGIRQVSGIRGQVSGVRYQVSGTEATKEVVFRTTGPFGFVRHPIYLGWILMVFAAPVMTIDRVLFAVISSLYLVLAIPWEEKSLVAAFGDRYRGYQSTVRWRLIPGIW